MTRNFLICLIVALLLITCAHQKSDYKSAYRDLQPKQSTSVPNSEGQPDKNYNDSTGNLFLEFCRNFKPWASSEVVDIPPISWRSIAMDSAYLISEKYMNLFVKRNLEVSTSFLEASINLPNKSILLESLGYYVCKMKHTNDDKIAALLIVLCSNHIYSIFHDHLYYLLSYHWVSTGEPLGYDIIAGSIPSPSDSFYVFRGKLKLESQSVIIGNAVFSNEEKVYSKYRVMLNQDKKAHPQIVHTNDLLI
ncbi:MAG: hypothetical protein HC880_10440, partial [Bacteroidia bacterium]|nr:hypothetical protein [Bacteroidia bacterium]